ncbi:DNA polymerase-3 subunit epsilon [Halospina denitrificans]|uniref:DNA polymerase III subunit epsilon n=1 Tax=Halospina denitrificans TaxID=332522 RepID=A0A4R7JTC0_9GAMM|nr:DNA polymerase III subunit epsilon [Halospina denitrificans]TDT41520.1 DNA polymerase-3 subunit epsilon [Halospina denitrificans]
MRQIVLDTETTGLEPEQGHRVIEIGCVELENRELTGRHYHVYINPEREVEDSAVEVHGITNEFLADKPVFRDVADDFLAFIRGAELVIHNAPFDVGFMDHEFSLLNAGYPLTREICGVTDSLVLARKKHPGQKNNLDVLCRRYGIDNSNRELHGALLDAEILAMVYLAMTGGQTALSLDEAGAGQAGGSEIERLSADRQPLPVLEASEEEVKCHREFLDRMAEKTQVVWDQRLNS